MVRTSGLAGQRFHTSIPARLPKVDIRPAFVIFPAGPAYAIFRRILHEGLPIPHRKLAGDEAESNIRIDIPVPYSGVCPYVYQDENPVPISPRIATNGDVYLCQSFMDQRYCLGNINKDSLPHALFNENFINLVNFMTTGRFYMDDCNKCVLKYQCPRGCIGDCLANGSIHETDGGCFFRKENAIRQLLKQSEAIVAEHMQF